MEVVRRFIDASDLMSIMPLPEAFQGRKLEIIVLPTEEADESVKRADTKSIVRSLIGAIPATDMPLSALCEERLGKYETSHCYGGCA